MSDPSFKSVSPIFMVSNVDIAIAHYEHVFGFSLGWKWGSPTQVAAVCKDNIELMLERRPEGQDPAPSPVYVVLNDVQTYYEQACQAGAKVAVTLEERDYGMKDCRLIDLDGNELSFGERL